MAIDRSIDEDGQIKLLDFGLSLVRDNELEGKACMAQAVRTYGYMAPEIKGVSFTFQFYQY